MNAIYEQLFLLIIASIKEGNIPNHLKDAVVKPKFKKEDNEHHWNYQSIFITCSPSSIVEIFVRKPIKA